MTATPAQMADFVRLSAATTGIAASLIAPGVDELNVKQQYFDTAMQKDGAAFQQLLGILAANPTVNGDALANLVLNQSGDTMRYLGRAIMLMWFFGSWYNPADLQKAAGTNPPPSTVGFQVISAKAYTQGWIWSVAQAHPMGYSNLRFGYWNSQPPSLTDFIGGTGS